MAIKEVVKEQENFKDKIGWW